MVHFCDGVGHIVALEIHAPTRIRDEISFETQLRRIESSKLYAVVSGQSARENFGDTFHLEPFAESRGFAVAVVEQTAVAVNALVRAFGNDFGNALPLQSRRQIGT